MIREGAVIAERATDGHALEPPARAAAARAAPSRARFDVTHRTVYRYEQAGRALDRTCCA